jgi:hypothetical protein
MSDSTEKVDVAIAGAGLAGLATAVALHKVRPDAKIKVSVRDHSSCSNVAPDSCQHCLCCMAPRLQHAWPCPSPSLQLRHCHVTALDEKAARGIDITGSQTLPACCRFMSAGRPQRACNAPMKMPMQTPKTAPTRRTAAAQHQT